jgi:uncharacterized glyoxalase superfamily protein PhnB
MHKVKIPTGYRQVMPYLIVKSAGLFVYVEDADAAIGRALAEGAKSIDEIRDMEYGRSGGITDPYGNVWWITSIK